MSDQFMQEIQEEDSALEALEKKVSLASDGNVSVEAADDMIRANGEAQAIEVDALKDTVRAYQKQIEELKDLCDRDSALLEELRRMNVETTRGVQDVMKASSDAISESREAFGKVDFSGIQKDVRDMLSESEKKILDALGENQTKIENLLQQSDDFAHKENVRVYRNVQAATEQLLKKQSEDLKGQIDDLKKAMRPSVTPVQIAILVLSVVNLVLLLLSLLGVF